jgi:excisionase family DNA binding protein
MSATATQPLPRFLTVQETAALLRLSAPSVYRQIAEGKLPSVRSGRSLRIPSVKLLQSLGLEGDE